MSQMKPQAEVRRETFEGTYFSVGASLVMNEQAEIRVRQAIKRERLLADLLTPVLDHLSQMNKVMRSMQVEMGKDWENNNGHGW
jgi:hypothetical protein